MRLCILDCSVAMSLVFEDEANPIADALTDRLRERDSVVVPAVLWSLEVANALHRAVVRGRITELLAAQRRLALARLPVVTVPCPHGLGPEITDLTQAHGLTSYDAAYLAVAIAEGLPLASFDAVLRRAASAAGVALWSGEGLGDT